MSDIFIPFNFNPYSTSVKSSSYTIPSGYYALVTAYCEWNSSATFTIDGVTALETVSSGFTYVKLDFILPTGTVISGSGTWHAIVNLLQEVVQ
jgi:hypothetical protein